MSSLSRHSSTVQHCEHWPPDWPISWPISKDRYLYDRRHNGRPDWGEKPCPCRSIGPSGGDCIDDILNARMPRYYALTRLPSSMILSAWNVQFNCGQLVQIGLYMTKDTINPDKYAGMLHWDQLHDKTRRLILIARQTVAEWLCLM